MNKPEVTRRRRLALAALALNALALFALALSLGFISLGPLSWLKSSDSDNVTSSDGGSATAAASISLYDVFPPEEIHSPMPEGLEETYHPTSRAVNDDIPPAGEGEQPAPTAAAQDPHSATAVDPLDWTYWRGPRYDGTSPETGLVDSFDPRGGEGSNVLWKRDDLGTRSTPIVMNGKLYVLARADAGTDREGERVVCVDAMTGDTLWENRFNVWLSDVPDTRVGWSSVVGDPTTGYVYAQGVCGYFQCLDGDTGETIWSLPLHEFFGLLSTYGGRTNFPVICEDLIIVSGVVINWGDLAKPAHRFVAFDKKTGDIVWFNGTRIGPYDTTYSGPTVTTVSGTKMLIFGSGDGKVWAFQPRTGIPIWNYTISRRGLNVAPLVVGDTVYMGHSEENEVGTAMGTVLAIDATGTGNISDQGEKWRVFELMMGKSSPVLVGDRLYCIEDGAKLQILDSKTGEPVSDGLKLGTAMRGSPLYADGKIYLATANGRWAILRLDEEQGAEFVSRGRFSRESVDASPICSHGNVYFTTSGGIYCLRDPEKTPGVGSIPPQPQERSVEEDSAPAHVQVVPVEVLMLPGQTQSFQVRLFNASGQLLDERDAEYSVEGPGTITGDGLFTANTDASHGAAIITAQVGDLQGRARVRIVPPLPWEFTFDDLTDPPVTWVGVRLRHVVRDVDGNPALVKITTIPKGTRSRCWFGPSDLSNYTIQADVRGSIEDEKMPDIGIIAQGYAMDLQGANQELEIRSWSPQLRMASTIKFPWKPNVWYVMKLQALVETDQVVLRGKVWPRDTEEPAEWTIEATDPAPVRSGSPGLYGNAKDAEIVLDNIKVYSN
jgi:outer membrane protein assembly factor BamB